MCWVFGLDRAFCTFAKAVSTSIDENLLYCNAVGYFLIECCFAFGGMLTEAGNPHCDRLIRVCLGVYRERGHCKPTAGLKRMHCALCVLGR